MNIIILIVRLCLPLFFLLVSITASGYTFAKDKSDVHFRPGALIFSVIQAILYLWPLLVEVKRRHVKAKMPTKKSFTVSRLITAGRWFWAFFFGICTLIYFWENQNAYGILSAIIIPATIPPLDRVFFGSGREMTARLDSNGNFLKIFPNFSVTANFFAYGCYANEDYTMVPILLTISIALMSVVPLVLYLKRGWKALSLKPILLPVVDSKETPNPPIPQDLSFSDQLNYAKQQWVPINQKYYSAKASSSKWPLPKNLRRYYPLDELTFNLLIRGFENSWLESNDYYRKVHLHRHPATFTQEILTKTEVYLKSMRNRFALLSRNPLTSAKISTPKFAPDEISLLWKENKKLRSLYQAVWWFTESPNTVVFKPFNILAPHVAEYRAMINITKRLRHALRRMPKQEPVTAKKVAEKIITPMKVNETIPTVFISYSWDSPEHEKWIIELATKLRENGVDAILDKWDLGPLGKPLPLFMERSISHAQRVICVMTPNYKKKTENPTGGVGYEYSIITAEIFADSINTSKFIPLFRSGTPQEAIPIALAGRRYVDMRDNLLFEEKFTHELLRDIHDEPRFKKPALGKKPQF